jgi:hypothetical protein
MSPPPTRHVYTADALTWMVEHPAEPSYSVITSLPDVSELPHLGFEGWRTWFIDVARQVIAWIPEQGVAIFFQSDVRFQGVWVDKGYLIQRAAELSSACLIWHKIVCRHPPLTIALGRPSYSHMLCIARGSRAPAHRPGPDVLPSAGHMPWSRAMGTEACRVACEYLRNETATRVIVDPFCGQGTVLAVGNSLGFDAIGVDIGAKRCRKARSLHLGEITTGRPCRD